MAKRGRPTESRHGRVKLSKAHEALLDLAKDRFTQAQDATNAQRQRELEDLRFYAGDQWSDDAQQARRGQNATGGMPPIPARPCYVVNKLREPVRQVLNQERQSDMGIELVPADDFEQLVGPLDDTEIELREGLARRIQRSSEAADARTWAFTRSTIAGTGYYAVLVRFLPGKSWDKEVYLHRIYNQASVSLDPAHEQPDGSDAEWGFIGTDMAWAQYKAEFPTVAGKANQLCSCDDEDFRALGDEYPDWFTTKEKTKSCRVVQYWYTERTIRTLLLMKDGSSGWEDELKAGTPEDAIVDKREVIQKTIKVCKLDGAQILEETDWEGPDLPIVKVLGEELQPYDQERRAEGMVRPGRHSQEAFNALVSKGVETIGLSPIPPWQVTPEQVEGFEQWYQQSNTRALPYLPYNNLSVNGQPLERPTRTPTGTDVGAIFGAIEMFDQAIQSTTGVPESRVGRNTDAKLKSGKALQELRQSSEQGTSNFLDNLRRSIRYEGQILNNLLYPIYGKTPGRLVRIMSGEGDAQTVRIGPAPNAGGAEQQPPSQLPPMPPALGMPGMPPPSGGIPPSGPPPGMPPMPGQPPPMPGMPGMPGQPPAPKKVKQYTLTPDANFNVIVKVTRGYDSRREQEASIIGDLLSVSPVLMTWFGDLFFKHQDGPGHQEMAERAKVMLAPPIQQMLQAKDQGADLPPEVTQQLAQMKGQIQQAEQAMQAMQQELATKKAENDTKLQIAAGDAHTKVQIAQAELASKERTAAADRETKLAVAELGAKMDRMQLFLDERARVGLQQQDAQQADLERQHAAQIATAGQQHEAGMAAADGAQSADDAEAQRQHDAAMAQLGHQQSLEQQQQAAALQPPPVEPGAGA